jgi:predicted anti-sigma-YlaC factor YlaD
LIKCHTLVSLLFDYLGKELPGEECELVEEHLDGCPQCKAFADNYCKAARLARQLPPIQPPWEFLRELRLKNLGGRRNFPPRPRIYSDQSDPAGCGS